MYFYYYYQVYCICVASSQYNKLLTYYLNGMKVIFEVFKNLF
jgi:hypothetical protein